MSHDLPPDVPTDGEPPDDGTPADPELEALLRAQEPAPLPLGLVARILDELVPTAPLRPQVVVARMAAAVLVAFAAWFALAGELPALADVTPRAQVVAVLGPAALEGTAALPERWAATTTPAAAGDPAAVGFLVAGALVLLAGLLVAFWLAHHAPTREAGR